MQRFEAKTNPDNKLKPMETYELYEENSGTTGIQTYNIRKCQHT